MAHPGHISPPAAAAASRSALDINTYQNSELMEYLFLSIQRVDSVALDALFSSGRWESIQMSVFQRAYKVAQNVNSTFKTTDSQSFLETLTKFLAEHKMIDLEKALPATPDSPISEDFPNEEDLQDVASVVRPDPLYDYSDKELVILILRHVRNSDTKRINKFLSSKRIANLSPVSIRSILGQIPSSPLESVQRLVRTLEKLLKLKAEVEEEPPARPPVPAAAAAAIPAEELNVDALSESQLGAKLIECVKKGDTEQFTTLIASGREVPVHSINLAIRAGRKAFNSTGLDSYKDMVGYLESLLQAQATK